MPEAEGPHLHEWLSWLTILKYSAMLLVFCLCVMVYIGHQIAAGIDEGIDESVKNPKNILDKHSPAPQNQSRHSAP
jgi:hypothetical protein